MSVYSSEVDEARRAARLLQRRGRVRVGHIRVPSVRGGGVALMLLPADHPAPGARGVYSVGVSGNVEATADERSQVDLRDMAGVWRRPRGTHYFCRNVDAPTGIIRAS